MSAGGFNPQLCNSNEIAGEERISVGQWQLYLSLIRPYERAVFISAYCILQSEPDAEEVAAKAILQGFTRLRDLRAKEQFGAWLIHITVQEARIHRSNNQTCGRDFIDELSQCCGEDKGAEDTYIPKDFSDRRKIDQEELEDPQVRTALRLAIASLALKYRAVLVLCDVLKMNLAETAMALEISEASVKTRLLRARLELRDMLALHFARDMVVENQSEGTLKTSRDRRVKSGKLT